MMKLAGRMVLQGQYWNKTAKFFANPAWKIKAALCNFLQNVSLITDKFARIILYKINPQSIFFMHQCIKEFKTEEVSETSTPKFLEFHSLKSIKPKLTESTISLLVYGKKLSLQPL